MDQKTKEGFYMLDINAHFFKQKCQRHFLSLTGFTLIELLLAVSLFSIIAVAVYSSLAAGIKVYQRGNTLSGNYNDLWLSFDKIGRDLRSAVRFNNTFFVAESQKMQFFSIQPKSGGESELCKITYTWRREGKGSALYRLKEFYIDSVQETRGEGEILVNGISDLSFSYGYVKKTLSGEQELKWKEEWKEEAMPKMVRLNMKAGDDKFSKIIYCPAGKTVELKEG